MSAHAPHATRAAWHARGVMFENCTCTLVCPGHMHFSQLCTHERCIGYWAIRIDEGAYGATSLAGARVVIAFDSPQRMIDGGWTGTLILDETLSADQRTALEAVLTGKAGGPWEVIGRFVGTWLDTRTAAIRFEDDGPSKRAFIKDLFEAVVTPIRGRDRSRPVTFENIFNQIHGSTQTLALGRTRYDDGVIRIETKETHGLISNFEWAVSAGAA
ncbi:MAG: DUF1326 domain-containing protein [Acidobacteriota bacterium]